MAGEKLLEQVKNGKFYLYIGVDVITGDWVGGDHYYICNFNDTVWFRKITRDKRGRVRKREDTAWIVPDTLHVFNGWLEDGRPDYVRENLSWYNWHK